MAIYLWFLVFHIPSMAKAGYGYRVLILDI
jgi:hypothetical protein